VYRYVIQKSGSASEIGRLPKSVTVPVMKAAYKLGLSPLGPYQYKMIAEDFCFDTSRIKTTLGWTPTLSNEEMLYRAYVYYKENLAEIRLRQTASAHRKPAAMGVIRFLKWLS